MPRDFMPGDFATVVGLLHACGLGHPPNDPERDLERILGAAETRVFVEDGPDGLPGGVVVAAHEGRRGWIYYLAVTPVLRGHGIGEALVRHAEAWLIRRGAPKVLLLIRNDNLKVMDFYARLGYQEEPCTCMGRWLVDEHP